MQSVLDTIRRDVALMMKQVHNMMMEDDQMMTPDDYADQRAGVDLNQRHVSPVDLAFWCIVASGAVSVIAQWWA